MAEKLILVGAVEEMKPFQDQDWPLHVTVMPWFSVSDRHSESFIEALEHRASQEKSPLQLFGDEIEYFGSDRSIKVRTLRNISRIAQLHNDLLSLIARDYAGIVDSPYIGSQYRAHVTEQAGGKKIEKDQEIILENLQLVRGDVSGPRIVEHTFGLAKDTSR
jgi:2'-5' RNA ligase